MPPERKLFEMPSTEKVSEKLKPQKLPLELLPVTASSSKKGQLENQSVEKEKLKPQRLFLTVPGVPDVEKPKIESTEKVKLKPIKLAELQKDFVPKQSTNLNRRTSTLQVKVPIEATKRFSSNSHLDQSQLKKLKLNQSCARKKLFKEPAETGRKIFNKKPPKNKLQKKRVLTTITEPSISHDVTPLKETSLCVTEKKTTNFKVEMPKSCSPTPSEEFLELENAVKNEMSTTPNSILKKKNRKVPQSVEDFCIEIDTIRTSIKEQLEKIMTDVDQKLIKLKEEYIAFTEQPTENKENLIRRSPRLLKTRSPAFSPINTNLRMSTLKKNLEKRICFQSNSPKSMKMMKAEETYRKLRQICPSLDTPFKSRARELNQGQSLSEVLEQQCLLLQDTPARK